MNTEALVIRLVEPSDSIEEITQLLHRAYARLAAMNLRFVATHQDVEVTRFRLTQGEGYLAVINGKIIGTISLKAPGVGQGCEWYERKDVSIFNQFAIDPEFQQKGLGSRLLDFVEQR